MSYFVQASTCKFLQMPYFLQPSSCQFYQMPYSVQLLNFRTSYRLQGGSFSKCPSSYMFDTPNFNKCCTYLFNIPNFDRFPTLYRAQTAIFDKCPSVYRIVIPNIDKCPTLYRFRIRNIDKYVNFQVCNSKFSQTSCILVV